MKRIFPLLLLALVSERPARAESPALRLSEAVHIGIAQNPALQGARARTEEAERSKAIAYSGLFPKIGLNASLQHRKDSLNTAAPLFGGEPYNHYGFKFQATQPLFRGGAILGAISSVSEQEQLRELDQRIGERNYIQQVIRAFYGVLAAQMRLEVLERTEGVDQQLLAAAQERKRIGEAQQLEVLQVKTQLALLAPKLAQARGQLGISASELATLIGQADAHEIAVQGSLSTPAWERLQEYFGKPSTPRSERLELQRQEVLADILATDRKLALAPHLPRLDAVGEWGRAAFVKSELFDQDATGWALALEVSIPLFSGLSSVHERRALASREAELLAARRSVENQLNFEQVRATRELELARELAASSGDALKLAQESLKEAQKNYRLGITDFPPLLQTEESLLEAELAYTQAQYDFILKITGQAMASGLDLFELVSLLENKR